MSTDLMRRLLKIFAICWLLMLMSAGVIHATQVVSLGTSAEVWWEDSNTGAWKTVKQAKEYQVRLYENDQPLIRLTVQTNRIDLSDYLEDGNDYFFEVRAVAQAAEQGMKRDGDWVASSDKKIDTQGITSGRWKNYLDGNKYMLEDGNFVNYGWELISGNWYYFQQDGFVALGWLDDSGQEYYLSPTNGVLQTKWRYLDGNWYYFGTDGSKKVGWIEYLPGNWYYLGEDGKMITDQWIDGFYVNETGAWNSF